jgi:hypothetical protein
MLKYHLAKILGNDVDVFPNNDLEIMRIAFDSPEEKDKKKYEAAAKKDELSFRSSTTSTSEGQCSARDSIDSGIGRFTYFFVPRTTHGAQPSIK